MIKLSRTWTRNQPDRFLSPEAVTDNFRNKSKLFHWSLTLYVVPLPLGLSSSWSLYHLGLSSSYSLALLVSGPLGLSSFWSLFRLVSSHSWSLAFLESCSLTLFSTFPETCPLGLFVSWPHSIGLLACLPYDGVLSHLLASLGSPFFICWIWHQNQQVDLLKDDINLETVFGLSAGHP